jgi:hypothetical protein
MHRIGDIVKIMRHLPQAPETTRRRPPLASQQITAGRAKSLCYCAFCGDSENDAPVVAGPSCFICSKCVVRSVGALLSAGHTDFLKELAAQLEKYNASDVID